YPLPQDTRVRWTGFPIELFFWGAPLVCGFLIVSWIWIGRSLVKLGFSLPATTVPWLVIALGVTWAARIAFRYHGEFARRNVGQLLDDMDVSQMRPRAVELHGEIIGQGIPGAFWSPDLVLQDDTGRMFVLYRSTIPLGRLWFAVTNVDRFIGERVVVKGWYRRGLCPYVELSRIEATLRKPQAGDGPLRLFGSTDTAEPDQLEHIVRRSFSRWIQLGGAAL